MIKLDVQEYCHGCANFTADVKEPEKYHADFDIIEMTDTLVRCERRHRFYILLPNRSTFVLR